MRMIQHDIDLRLLLTSETSKSMLQRVVETLRDMEEKEILKMSTPYGIIIMSMCKSSLKAKVESLRAGYYKRNCTCRDVDCMQYKDNDVFYSWFHYSGVENKTGEYVIINNCRDKRKDRAKRKAMIKGWSYKSYALFFEI